MRTIKIMLAATLAAALLCSCCNCDQVKPLQVKGTQLYAGNQPVTFKGVSFGWHNIWPRFYNAEAVSYMSSEWNVPNFRAAIGIDSHAKLDNPDCLGGYIDEPEKALECLYNVVDAAIAANRYVIVDFHSHKLYPEVAEEFFTKVATRYKGVPNVIYELFNEPVSARFEEAFAYDDLGDPEAMMAYWLLLKVYAQKLIKVITDIDPSKPLILMGCPCWDQRIDLPVASPIEGYDNLMYTVHFYAATHKESLREATDAALKAGLPIFISECASCEATGDGPMDEESWKEWNDWADANGISRLAWSLSDKVETCSMLEPRICSTGPWFDIKPWGQTVIDWIE